ncbi:Zn-ribbon domain-containing OB-fold protein [Mumia quercus]|uniref:Zn-ribbon domain-containing OB-fold protein n=1 Tax=Mumia quercus TaxID=2976125 RepID=UPI0021CE0EB7|nr:OB-fold domain-containing protein [Mumia quercus]
MSTDWVPGDVPPADEVTADFWDATREHRLTVQTCACGHRQHPPRALCTSCGATEALSQAASPGRGVVDAYTVVHRAPRPDLAVPYVVARVRLDEGVLLLSRLEGRHDPEAWSIGDAVGVAWADLPDGRALPFFLPTDPTEESR